MDVRKTVKPVIILTEVSGDCRRDEDVKLIFLEWQLLQQVNPH